MAAAPAQLWLSSHGHYPQSQGSAAGRCRWQHAGSFALERVCCRLVGVSHGQSRPAHLDYRGLGLAPCRSSEGIAMRRDMGCHRRGVLAGLVGVFASGACATATEAGGSVAAAAAHAFRDLRAARRLGKTFALALVGTPRGALTVSALESSLQSRLGWPAGGASPSAFAMALRHRCQADFLAGRCVSIDGWVLSESEVDLHLLLAMTA